MVARSKPAVVAQSALITSDAMSSVVSRRLACTPTDTQISSRERLTARLLPKRLATAGHPIPRLAEAPDALRVVHVSLTLPRGVLEHVEEGLLEQVEPLA